jgi:hypothetical protein
MNIKLCKECGSKAVFYNSPDNKKVLGCCGNGRCVDRQKPPISGSDYLGSIIEWNNSSRSMF